MRRGPCFFALFALTAGIAGAQEPPGEKTPGEEGGKIRWQDGETVLESGSVRISLQNRIQFRFIDELPDAKTQLAGTLAPGDSRPSFKIRRAKTRIEGSAWSRELSFEVQLSWVGGDPGATATSPLEDAEIVWDPRRDGALRVHLGQYKVPFGRQEMTSSEDLQFADRSLLSGEFTHGRDVGVSLQGRIAKGRLDYMLGAFNGNQRNRPTNDNGKFQYDARVVFQPWGDVGYSEGDFESQAKPLLALAAQFESNDQRGATNADDLDTSSWGGDLVFKRRGLSLFAEYFARRRRPEISPTFRSDGFNLQAGYLFWLRRLELALRHARFDPTDKVAGNDHSEWGCAFGYFARKHHLKLQADVRRLRDDDRDTKDHEVRLQMQVVF